MGIGKVTIVLVIAGLLHCSNSKKVTNPDILPADIVGNWTTHKRVADSLGICGGALLSRAYTYCISVDSMNHTWIDSCNGTPIVYAGDGRNPYQLKGDSLFYAYNRIINIVGDSTWSEYLYVKYKVTKQAKDTIIFANEDTADTCAYSP